MLFRSPFNCADWTIGLIARAFAFAGGGGYGSGALEGRGDEPNPEQVVAEQADDPLLREIDEELRQEKYLQIWSKYGAYIVIVVVLIVGGVAGFQGWRKYTLSQNQAAGEQFHRSLELAQSNQPDNAAQALGKLAQEGPAGYAMLARFEHASLLARKGDKAGAATIYASLAQDRKVEALYRDLAVLLGTMEEMDTADPATLIQRLAPLTNGDNPWRFSAREVTGMLAFRKGDKDQAQSLFGVLASDPNTPQGIRQRAEIGRAHV